MSKHMPQAGRLPRKSHFLTKQQALSIPVSMEANGAKRAVSSKQNRLFRQDSRCLRTNEYLRDCFDSDGADAPSECRPQDRPGVVG